MRGHALTLLEKDVAAQFLGHGTEMATTIVEQRQRRLGVALRPAHARQTDGRQARHGSVVGILARPVQHLARRRQLALPSVQRGDLQRSGHRIRRTAVIADQGVACSNRCLTVISVGRGEHLGEEGAGGLSLLLAMALPGVPAENTADTNYQTAHQGLPVLGPPLLDALYLFVFVVSHLKLSSSNSNGVDGHFSTQLGEGLVDGERALRLALAQGF